MSGPGITGRHYRPGLRLAGPVRRSFSPGRGPVLSRGVVRDEERLVAAVERPVEERQPRLDRRRANRVIQDFANRLIGAGALEEEHHLGLREKDSCPRRDRLVRGLLLDQLEYTLPRAGLQWRNEHYPFHTASSLLADAHRPGCSRRLEAGRDAGASRSLRYVELRGRPPPLSGFGAGGSAGSQVHDDGGSLAGNDASITSSRDGPRRGA